MDYEDSKKSQFNAGVAMAERIDGLQKGVTSSYFNPLMQNPDTGTFNYENLITLGERLVAEGWGKFSKDEREISLRMLKAMKSMVKQFPLIEPNQKTGISINPDNYEKFINFYGMFERKMKEFYDEHDLNSPTKDDDEGL